LKQATTMIRCLRKATHFFDTGQNSPHDFSINF